MKSKRFPKKVQKIAFYTILILLTLFLLSGCGSSDDDDDDDVAPSNDTEITDTETDTVTDTETDIDTDTETDTVTDTETDTVTETETDTVTITETETETVTETETETDTEPDTEPIPDPGPQISDLQGTYVAEDFLMYIAEQDMTLTPDSPLVGDWEGGMTVAADGAASLSATVEITVFANPIPVDLDWQIIEYEGDRMLVESDECANANHRDWVYIQRDGEVFTLSLRDGYCQANGHSHFVLRRISTHLMSMPAPETQAEINSVEKFFQSVKSVEKNLD